MAKKTYKEGDLLEDNDGKSLKLFRLNYTEMVFVEKGTFIIGNNNSSDTNEKPETEITFPKGYFIGKYAVTQALYEAVMVKNPSKFKGKYRPVDSVSHDDICENNGFLDQLNAKIKNEQVFWIVPLPCLLRRSGNMLQEVGNIGMNRN